jgi:hypothetical protein
VAATWKVSVRTPSWLALEHMSPSRHAICWCPGLRTALYQQEASSFRTTESRVVHLGGTANRITSVWRRVRTSTRMIGHSMRSTWNRSCVASWLVSLYHVLLQPCQWDVRLRKQRHDEWHPQERTRFPRICDDRLVCAAFITISAMIGLDMSMPWRSPLVPAHHISVQISQNMWRSG